MRGGDAHHYIERKRNSPKDSNNPIRMSLSTKWLAKKKERKKRTTTNYGQIVLHHNLGSFHLLSLEDHSSKLVGLRTETKEAI